MRLQKLTGLERKKVEDEYRETIKLITKLKAILASKQLQLQIIKDELLAIREKYADARRTEIVYDFEEFRIEDMIAQEEVVITISHGGFIKRFPVSGYRRQSRGGKGVTGAASREDDFVEHMFIASTHNYILFFTDQGQCYWLKVFEIPEGGRTTKGKSIVNLISKDPAENISSFLAVKDFNEKNYIVMVTEQGLVKKTSLAEFSNPRKNGIAAISLKKKDLLKDVKLTDGTSDLIIGTHEGLAIRFHEDEVREMGLTAAGVRAIRLEKGDRVVGAVALKRATTSILVATENGYGKRSEVSEYRVSHRGGKGIYTVNATEKTGKMIAIKEVLETDDIVVVTSQGMVIRQDGKEIRLSGRNTQGVRLIRLDEGDRIADVAVVTPEEEEENGVSEKSETPPPPASSGKGEAVKDAPSTSVKQKGRAKKPEAKKPKSASKKKK